MMRSITIIKLLAIILTHISLVRMYNNLVCKLDKMITLNKVYTSGKIWKNEMITTFDYIKYKVSASCLPNLKTIYVNNKLGYVIHKTCVSCIIYVKFISRSTPFHL